MRRFPERWRPDLGVLVEVTGLLALSGVLIGVLWASVTPRAGIVVRDGGSFLVDPETSAFVAADGWFAVLTAAAGLVGAVLGWRLRHCYGVALVLAAVVGGTSGALIAWRVGHLLGPPPVVEQLADAEGVREAPLQLRARGVLLAWPLTAVSVLLLLTARTGRTRSVRADGGPGELDCR